MDCHQAASQDLMRYLDTRESDQQELENISRELLRLLPDRIASRVKESINDDRTLAYWNRFATNYLPSVVQQTLQAITTITSVPLVAVALVS